MAWSTADLSAAYQAKKSADKPILVAHNALRSGNAVGKFTQTGTYGGTDIASTIYPVARVWNGAPNLFALSAPSGSPTVVDLYFQISSGQSFDVVAILNLIAEWTGTLNVSLVGDDASSFASNPVTIAQWTSVAAGTKRLVEFDLGVGYGAPQRFADVEFLRLRFSASTSVDSLAIGEVWIGKRRQLHLRGTPGKGFDDFGLESGVSVFQADSGDEYTFQRWGGKKVIEATWTIHDQESIPQVQELRNFFKETDFGSRSFLYCERPETKPEQSMVMRLANPRLVMPVQEFNVREAKLSMRELPPYYAEEASDPFG